MDACNITPKGVTRRVVLGVVLLIIGVVLAYFVIAGGYPWYVRLGLVVLPMTIAVLSLLQAREKV